MLHRLKRRPLLTRPRIQMSFLLLFTTSVNKDLPASQVSAAATQAVLQSTGSEREVKSNNYLHVMNHELLQNEVIYNSKSVFSNPKSKQIAEKNIFNILAERKKVILAMAKDHPNLVGAYALPLLTRKLLPKDAAGLFEEPKTLTGDLLVFHGDDFTRTDGDFFEYQLVVSGKKFSFYPVHPVNFVPGSRVSINGLVLDNIIVGDLSTAVASQTYQDTTRGTALSRVTAVEHKVAVIMVNYTDAPAAPFTATTASNLIFNGAFQSLYTEQSYSKIHFSGDVFGWYTIPRETAGCNNPSIGWGGDLDSIIAANAINLSNYQHVLVVTNCNQNYDKGFAYIGVSPLYINGQTYNLSVSWVNGSGANFLSNSIWSQSLPPTFPWTNLDSMVSHEMGHALGLFHANAYDCGGTTSTNKSFGKDPNCQKIEYGNAFDVMGDDRAFGLHLNAFYKDLVGWLDGANSKTVNATGSYTLSKYENGTGTKAMRIQRPGTVEGMTVFPYYIEYRRGLGFDSLMGNSALSTNKNGLMITRAYSDSNPPYNLSALLDMRPTASPWSDDVKTATLNGTKVFTDARNGITIGPISSSTTTQITFNVTINPIACVRQVPMYLFPETYGLTIGQGSQFQIYPTVYNDDYSGCAPADMKVTMALPAGLTASPLSTTFTALAPEQAGTLELPLITASGSIAPGIYNITLTAKNMASNKISTTIVPITVVN